jgi:hypothetical protein
LNLALRLKPAAAARRLEAFKVVGAFLGVCIRLNVEAGLFISAVSLLLRSTVHTPQCHGRTSDLDSTVAIRAALHFATTLLEVVGLLLPFGIHIINDSWLKSIHHEQWRKMSRPPQHAKK